MVARRLTILFRVAVASTPSSPSTKAKKGEEVPTLLEASLQIHLLFPMVCLVEALFRVLFLVCGYVSVHNTHAVNTVGPLLPEVTDKKVSLLFRDLCRLRW